MRILRVVGSRTLPCGCLVGVYETYDGPCVEVLDVIADRCNQHHAEHPGFREWLRRAVHFTHPSSQPPGGRVN